MPDSLIDQDCSEATGRIIDVVIAMQFVEPSNQQRSSYQLHHSLLLFSPNVPLAAHNV